VRIGLLSDIHCKADALSQAIDDMSGTVDEILIAGDLMYEYRFSNEVIEIIRDSGARAITGNHEMVLLSPMGEAARAAPGIRESNLAFLAALPTRIDTTVGGKRLTMVHGAPWSGYDNYLVASNPDLRRCADVDADYLVLGHTHLSMVERCGDVLVINPGSVGEGRGRTRECSYAVLDSDSDEVTIHPLAPIC
jgi:putative phosphoesterase